MTNLSQSWKKAQKAPLPPPAKHTPLAQRKATGPRI